MLISGAKIEASFWMPLEGVVATGVKFSQDVVSLGDLKTNPGKTVRRAGESGRPVLLTSHGRGVAVLQGLEAFEAAEEERAFMRAVVVGLADLDDGREVSLAEAKRRLDLSP